MKRIFIILSIILAIFFINYQANAWLISWWWWWAWADIDSYLQGSKLVDASWDYNIETWFKNKIVSWVIKLGWFLGLVAVWAIVYWALMMVISTWEEEKIKKAKNIVKWAILGFLWIVLASSIIAIIVKFMYTF